MAETGYLPTRSITVHDTLLGRADDDRFSFLERRLRLAAVPGGNRLLDPAHQITQLGAAAFVDLSTASDLARSLAGGTGIGHAFARCGRAARSSGQLSKLAA